MCIHKKNDYNYEPNDIFRLVHNRTVTLGTIIFILILKEVRMYFIEKYSKSFAHIFSFSGLIFFWVSKKRKIEKYFKI